MLEPVWGRGLPLRWTPFWTLWQRSRKNDVKNTYPSHLPSRSLQKARTLSQVSQNPGGGETPWRCRLRGFQRKFPYPTEFSPWIRDCLGLGYESLVQKTHTLCNFRPEPHQASTILHKNHTPYDVFTLSPLPAFPARPSASHMLKNT